ncbi:MAG: phosphatase PAP2 family protein [Candidatus Firestonebacteria bacterium]
MQNSNSKINEEIITIIYQLIIAWLIFLFRFKIPNFEIYLSITLAITVMVSLVRLISCDHKDPILNSVRHWYSIAVLLISFFVLGKVIQYINPQDIDNTLIKLDYFIFGVNPTVWLEKITFPILTEILQIIYCTYFFLPIFFGVILLSKGKHTEFHRVLSSILCAFYFNYILYIIFPAIGPRYTLNHLQSFPLTGIFFTSLIRDGLSNLEGIHRDVFPSGHTAVPLVVLYFSYKYERKIFYILLPIVIAMIFSTVYLRYHYVIDVISGVVLAGISIKLFRVVSRSS